MCPYFRVDVYRKGKLVYIEYVWTRTPDWIWGFDNLWKVWGEECRLVTRRLNH